MGMEQRAGKVKEMVAAKNFGNIHERKEELLAGDG